MFPRVLPGIGSSFFGLALAGYLGTKETQVLPCRGLWTSEQITIILHPGFFGIIYIWLPQRRPTFMHTIA